MMANYRKGGIGAVIDEYERAAAELKKLIERISDLDYIKIVDTKTKDEDCRSVQTIVSHVTNSGYGYANYIRDWFSIPKSSPERSLLTQNDFVNKLESLLNYCPKLSKANGNILTMKFRK